ncbi:hypothetical protein TNCV_1743121 [Trichonephila clavipes]|nr:hypothetical protein TNCV_1743121 [Trichonephila clavipes]
MDSSKMITRWCHERSVGYTPPSNSMKIINVGVRTRNLWIRSRVTWPLDKSDPHGHEAVTGLGGYHYSNNDFQG